MKSFYLGDREFNIKLEKIHSWIMPIVYGGLFTLFLSQSYLLTAGIFSVGFIITMPLLKYYLEKLRILGTIKVLFCIAVFILAILSVEIYI